MEKHKKLNEPYNIGKVTIKNRFCMAPMHVAPHEATGALSEFSLRYYTERARGGFGLLFVETQVTDEVVDKQALDGHIIPSALSHPFTFRKSAIRLTETCHRYGAKVFVQVTLGSGRAAPGLKGPSSVEVFGDPSTKTEALTKEEIHIKRQAVIDTALLCKNSGFDGVELHAMHCSYLLDSFAMEITNQRTDEYGGSLENRMRLAKELVEGIKEACGQDFPVSMRLAMKSFMKGLNKASYTGEAEAGRTLEEGIEICKLLESYGYDSLNVDVGTYDSMYYIFSPMYIDKGYTLKFAKAAKAAVNIPILVGGSRLDEPHLALQAIADDTGDAVVLGRSSIADPTIASKMIHGRMDEVRPCIGCNNCIHTLFSGFDTSCSVNPTVAREDIMALYPALTKKNIVVAGGGLAGMEFAVSATRRGHKVTIYEKASELGGLAIVAGKHDFKKDIARLVEWYKKNIAELGIEVYLNTELTAEKAKELKPDVIILSTGSRPIELKFEGSDRENVLGFIEAIVDKKPVGDKVVVVGAGQTGCELAYEYGAAGKEVTLIEALDDILSSGAVVPMMNKMALSDIMEHYNVNVMTSSLLVSVDDTGVNVKRGDAIMHIDADTVVMAIGLSPSPTMERELADTGIEVFMAGDSLRVADIRSSVSNGYELARTI